MMALERIRGEITRQMQLTETLTLKGRAGRKSILETENGKRMLLYGQKLEKSLLKLYVEASMVVSPGQPIKLRRGECVSMGHT